MLFQSYLLTSADSYSEHFFTSLWPTCNRN